MRSWWPSTPALDGAGQQDDLASLHRQDCAHAGLGVGVIAVSWKRLLPRPDRAGKIREIGGKLRPGSDLVEASLRGILAMSQTGSKAAANVANRRQNHYAAAL